MKVSQIYSLMNSVTSEILGDSALLKEDLTNITDIGNQVFDATNIDNYVKKLVDHIGKVIFVDRVYSGNAPSVLMDGWEFGSVLEKIQADIPEAEENDSWNLVDGESYDPNIFYQPSVSAMFFNKKVTFEIPVSFTEMQVKSSFSSAAQLNGFLSMIFNAVEKSMSVKLDALIMRTINNMTAQTLYNEYKTAKYGDSSGIRAVNLLKLYNDKFTKTLTAAASITDPDFIRFASYTISLYVDRLTKLSTLFNIGGKERFTPNESLHIILLSDFEKAANVYLQSDTFHDMYVSLPNAEKVPYWQGSGTAYDFNSVSGIYVTTQGASSSANVDVQANGILGVMFDRNALGVANLSRRVTSNYNPKAEFYTNFYKMDAGYFNDLNENFVVFFVADPTPAGN